MDRCSSGGPLTPAQSVGILKYCKKEHCICTPGRPVGSFPLPSCQFFLSVSEFQGQRALPQSTFGFSYDLAMEDQSCLTRALADWSLHGKLLCRLSYFPGRRGKENKGCLGKPALSYHGRGMGQVEILF